MAAYKVEICGVTTSKLPILKEEEKKELIRLLGEVLKNVKEECE